MFVQNAQLSAFRLRDGTAVCLRPVHPDDAPRLQDLFAQLSPQSRFFRFLTYWRELALERAEYLANVDCQSRMGFVATRSRGDEEEIIGIASYACVPPPEERAAEAAIVVDDRYQGMGLGTALLHRLVAYARACKICTFIGTVHSENVRMLEWIANSGLCIRWEEQSGAASEFQVRIELTSELES